MIYSSLHYSPKNSKLCKMNSKGKTIKAMRDQKKAGILLSYGQTFLSTIISLVYTPVMLRLLGQSEYGLYTLVNGFISNLSLMSFGLGSAYVRFYAKAEAEEGEDGVARINGMFLTIFFVIGALSLITGAVLVLNVHRIFAAKLTQKEKATSDAMQITYEILSRGIEILPVDLYKSDVKNFLPENGKIRLPFITIQGLGESAAESIYHAMHSESIYCVEEFKEKSGVGKGVIETLRANGILDVLPETNQLSLF